MLSLTIIKAEHIQAAKRSTRLCLIYDEFTVPKLSVRSLVIFWDLEKDLLGLPSSSIKLWHIDRQDRWSDRQTDWPSDHSLDQLTDQQTYHPTDWPSNPPTDQPTDPLTNPPITDLMTALHLKILKSVLGTVTRTLDGFLCPINVSFNCFLILFHECFCYLLFPAQCGSFYFWKKN